MKILFVCILISNLIFAQETALTTDYKKLALPNNRGFNHPKFSDKETDDFYYITSYDKFTNSTTVILGFEITKELSMKVVHLYYGKDRSLPETIYTIFISSSKAPIYKNNQLLYFLVDNKRMNLGQLYYKTETVKNKVIERLDMLIPFNDFLRIINSEKVEFKIYENEFTLGIKQLEALRDFASRLDD